MAHYFHHLARINRQFFTLIAIVYARLTNDNWDYYWLYGENDTRKLLPSILQVIYVVLNWVCIRYHYRLPFNLLLHSFVMVIEPINLLYSFVRPGKKQQMNLLDQNLYHEDIISGTQLIDNQWRPTLSIINIGSIVLRKSVELSQTSTEEKTISIFITFGSCCWMYHLCKSYFNTYVVPVLN